MSPARAPVPAIIFKSNSLEDLFSFDRRWRSLTTWAHGVLYFSDWFDSLFFTPRTMLFYHCFLQVVIRKTPLFPLHHISFRLMRFDFVWLIVVVVIVVVVSLQFLLFYSAKTKWRKQKNLKRVAWTPGNDKYYFFTYTHGVTTRISSITTHLSVCKRKKEMA